MNTELILGQAVKVFTDVNARINLLIDCSAKDFDILNKGFKEYHSKIKSLTDSTRLLFQELLSIPDDDLHTHTAQVKTIKAGLTKLYNATLDSDRFINLINKEFAYAILHLNNQKQNTSTLKLLTTNIQLEPKSRALYSELMGWVKKLQEYVSNIFTASHQTEKAIQLCAEQLGTMRSEKLPLIIHNLDRYEKMLSGLANKKKFCLKNLRNLEELISRKSVSSSEIITNLQFQDIIRQKIEHVQEAHTELLKKLKQYNAAVSEQPDGQAKEIVAIIMQIRDIGALQAAQLVHANNEYQKAVEVITEKFEELDHVLTDLIRLLNKLMPKIESYKEHPVDELAKLNKQYMLEIKMLEDHCSRLKTTYPEISVNHVRLITANMELCDSLNKLRKIINKLEPRTTRFPSKGPADLGKQLSGNFDDFVNSSQELTSILEQNHGTITRTVNPSLESFFTQLQKQLECSLPFTNMSQLLFPSENSPDLGFGIIDYEQALKEQKFDSGKVQYYSVFDKEIEEIITNLNTLIGKIDFKEIEKEFDDKNLKDIQKLYTMKSERDVHSMVTGKKSKTDQAIHDLELFDD